MAKQLPLTVLALAALGACATASTRADQGPDTELAEAVEGKVAGKPQNCIDPRTARGSQITRDAIVFRESRRLVYVSETPGCRTSGFDPILVTRQFGARLCSGDLVTLVDRGSGFPGPSCPLGKFTPYRAPG